jgi:exopolysaccharide biosynthesis polyprenyl glycosylphosphotransferase
MKQARDPSPSVGAEGASAPRAGLAKLLDGRAWVAFRLTVDSIMLFLGLAAALIGAPPAQASLEDAYVAWLFPPLTIALMALWRMYRGSIQIRAVDGLPNVVGATSLAAITLIAAAALIDPASESAPLIARVWLFGTLYLAGGRILLWWSQHRALVIRLVAKRTLIIGAGNIGARVERRLLAQPEVGLLPIGYLDADPPPAHMIPHRTLPVLGTPCELGAVADATGAEHVVLGFSTAPDHSLIPLVRECEARRLEVTLVPRLFESINVHIAVNSLGGLPLLELRSVDPKGWQFAIKHALDRVGAMLTLVVLAPLMIILALLVKVSSPGPVLLSQIRNGRDGREFGMLKFRSMRLHPATMSPDSSLLELLADVAPGGVEGYDRRTRIGALLRRTSLDELPQLFNVLRGEMSFVGPRPERPHYVKLFGTEVARYTDRHRVKSGITGWAQVNRLRGKTSISDRVEWDNYYIENWSFALDLKIIAMTVAAVSKGAE